VHDPLDDELLDDELLDEELVVVVESFLHELAKGAIKATPSAANPPFKNSFRSIVFN
jgi:hypothetical protein